MLEMRERNGMCQQQLSLHLVAAVGASQEIPRQKEHKRERLRAFVAITHPLALHTCGLAPLHYLACELPSEGLLGSEGQHVPCKFERVNWSYLPF